RSRRRLTRLRPAPGRAAAGRGKPARRARARAPGPCAPAPRGPPGRARAARDRLGKSRGRGRLGGAMSVRAEAARRGHGLRGRLLAAFVLVAVPPLLLFAVFVMALLSDRLERAAGQRLRQGLDGVRARVGALQHQAETAVAAIVRADLARPASSEEDARQMAATLGERHGLPLLEIVDGSGRVLSSRQWPAGVGLPEGDREVAGVSHLRWETVADDYGAAERLAVVATRPATWGG